MAFEPPGQSLSSALAVLAAMITPALLISATGTFILSTSNRLGRVVDRVRVVSDKMEEMMHTGHETDISEARRSLLRGQITLLSKRANLLQRCLTVFYLASGMFVATSVAIGIVALFSSEYTWIPVALGILGACLLFYGSVILIFEARLALAALRDETAFFSMLANYHPRP